jgi:hypothetical protein
MKKFLFNCFKMFQTFAIKMFAYICTQAKQTFKTSEMTRLGTLNNRRERPVEINFETGAQSGDQFRLKQFDQSLFAPDQH